MMLLASDKSNEVNIWMLSKSMGMKELSFLLAYLIIGAIGSAIVGTLYGAFIYFYVLTHSSFILILASIYSFVIASMFHLVFVVVVGGKFGVMIYAFINLLCFIVQCVFGFIVMIPTAIIVPLGLLSPLAPFLNIIKAALLF